MIDSHAPEGNLIQEIGTIVGIEKDKLWLQTEAKSTCGHCSSSGCSSSVLAKLFNARPNRFQIPKPSQTTQSFREGDRIKLSINDSTLVKAALIMYLVPLFIMIAGTLSAQQMGASDITQGVIALLSLGLGFSLVRLLGRRSGHHFTPHLIHELTIDKSKAEKTEPKIAE